MAHDLEVEEVARVSLRCGSGAVSGREVTSYPYRDCNWLLRRSGTRGTILLKDGEVLSLELENASVRRHGEDGRALTMPSGHRAQLADIILAITLDGRPSVSGEDGYRALKLIGRLCQGRVGTWGRLPTLYNPALAPRTPGALLRSGSTSWTGWAYMSKTIV